MRERIRVTVTLAAVVAVLSLAVASVVPAGSPVTSMSIAASRQGGAWYPMAVAVGELVKGKVQGLESYSVLPGGGAANPVAVDEGKATMGISTAVSTYDAFHGQPPYKRAHDKIRVLAAQYNQHLHVVTLGGSGIESVKDLKGKRVNVGGRGLTSELVARAVLKVNGMSYDDLGFVSNVGFADAANQMRDRRVDAIIWLVDAPFIQFKDLAHSHDIKLVRLSAEELAAVRKLIPGLAPSVIPAGVYRGVDHEVASLMSANVMLVGAQVDAAFVYDVTRAYVENFPRLQEASPVLKQVKDVKDLASLGIDVPFHPGAERYYKERGWR